MTRGNGCKIDHCSCGAVHVTVGAVTTRIRPEAARELRDALVRAMAEIDAQGTTPDQPRRAPFRVVLGDQSQGADQDDDDDEGPKVH